jgi:hypothetical protein
VEKACGRAKHEASYNDQGPQHRFGALDYTDASGNLVHFEFGPNGVIVTYADPKHGTNPDLIDSEQHGVPVRGEMTPSLPLVKLYGTFSVQPFFECVSWKTAP